jgi:ribosomal protein S18 acetylase RimI-like enzyme
MQIRDYKTNDYTRVLALWQNSGLIMSRSDSKESLQKQLKRDPDLFIVAEEDGRILGVVLGRWEGRRGWINRLAVAPEQRSKNLGSQMVKEVENRLKAKGCEKVNLLIDAGNAGVQDFYRKLGYNNDDLIFMEKWLVKK